MKDIIGLWACIFLGAVTSFFSGAVFFLVLFMPAQVFFREAFAFGIIAGLLLFLISIIGILKLKKWGKNLFVTITLIMNLSLILLFGTMWFTSKSTEFLIINIIFITWIAIFISYFLGSAMRELFK